MRIIRETKTDKRQNTETKTATETHRAAVPGVRTERESGDREEREKARIGNEREIVRRSDRATGRERNSKKEE